MIKKIFLYFSLLFIYSNNLYAICMCCPSSCEPVRETLTIAVNDSKEGITQEDLEMATNWFQNIEPILKEIDDIELSILDEEIKFKNIEEHKILQKLEEEYLLLSLMEEEQQSNRAKILNNKLKLFESKLIKFNNLVGLSDSSSKDVNE